MAEPRSTVVPIQPHGSMPPVFGVPGSEGDVFVFLRLAERLGAQRPVYALQPPGYETDEKPIDRVEALAARFVADLCRLQPAGPYHLVAFCYGGLVAFEMARMLRARGERVLLVLMGVPYPTCMQQTLLQSILGRIPWHIQQLRAVPVREWPTYAWLSVKRTLVKFRWWWRRARGLEPNPAAQTVGVGYQAGQKRVEHAADLSCRYYDPQPLDGPLHLFLWDETQCRWAFSKPLEWTKLAPGNSHVIYGPAGCGIGDVLKEPYVQFYAAHLRRLIEEVERPPDTPGLVSYRPLDFDARVSVTRRLAVLADEARDRICLLHDDEAITFGALHARSNQLARHLRAVVGVQPGEVVALVMERNVRTVESILALWKCGAAYLPISLDLPLPAMSRILAASQVRHALIDSSRLTQQQRSALAEICPLQPIDASTGTEQAEDDIDYEFDPSSLAYVIYTSGSTGIPKGAMIEHAGLLNHLHAKIADLAMDERSVVAQTASIGFDISVWQMFAALFAGGQTVIYDRDLQLEPARFVERLASDRVSVLEVVPSYLETLLDSGLSPTPSPSPGRGMPALTSLEFLLVTGEAITPQLANRWLDLFPSIRLMNAYGPTEASDDITHHIIERLVESESVPIGRPIPNVRIYLLDEDLRLCPPGVKGEICVAGICVGRGYLHDAERTAAVFVPDPFQPSERMYRTGDIGRWTDDGILEFFGRQDGQVKIRGFRVELGEVEACLRRCPGVKSAVAAAVGTLELQAWVVLEPGGLVETCQSFLRAQLPAPMVPSRITAVEQLPLTPNGKIDRRALASAAASHEPQTATERMVVDVLRDVLSTPDMGIEDDFFSLGGNSLLAMRAAARLHELSGIEVPIPSMLERRSAAGLARLLDERRQSIAR
jgi:amino acid adenylation domain-containing protein